MKPPLTKSFTTMKRIINPPFTIVDYVVDEETSGVESNELFEFIYGTFEFDQSIIDMHKFDEEDSDS